eukprot:GHVR01002803.1.p1 GENE.GHVR01002803.1~~GHVR01002803.1.p1  ORF type:complete len:3479 (-),score=561.50 GHVR01002803.1:2759-13195(-)
MSKDITNYFEKILYELTLENPQEYLSESEEELENYCAYSIGCVIKTILPQSLKNKFISIEQLRERLNISQKYYKLFYLIINILNEKKLIEYKKETKEVNFYLLQNKNLESEKKQILSNLNKKEVGPRINLLDSCINKYSNILRGQLDPIKILFNNGTFNLVEKFYRDHETADWCNNFIASVLFKYIKFFPKIYILEIGAGTGSTTDFIFNKISKAKHYIKYYYTDVSLKFINYARKKYESEHPFVFFKKLDITSVENEVDLHHKFDIIIATNVLHATPNIKTTIENIKILLKPSGVLVLNELTYRQNLASLVFGLLDGWWLAEDQEDRIPFSPLLSKKNWHAALIKCGFKNINMFDSPKLQGQALQNVILAYGHETEQKDIKLCDDQFSKKLNDCDIENNSKNSDCFNKKQVISKEVIKKWIKNLIEDALNLSHNTIDDNQEFSELGLDSLTIHDLHRKIVKYIPNLPIVIFFEYNNVESLSVFLFNQYSDKLMKYLGGDEKINEIKYQQSLIKVKRNFITSDIAIIGINFNFPKSKNFNEFWKILSTKHNCIDKIGNNRWWSEKYFDLKKCIGKYNTEWGSFIDDIDKFDPLFFKISPREAELMDPQERKLLECVYGLLENAGYILNKLQNKEVVGVFTAITNNYYNWIPEENWRMFYHKNSSSAYWSLANRISYIFNLYGPSLAVDTACSSSLTAIHLACGSILNEESTISIVGTSNLILHPRQFVELSHLEMLSKGKKNCSFGKNGDGFVYGEGVGGILLKRLDRAIEDRDQIYGVIKGTAINSGGKTNGYTVPNPKAQTEVISKALKKANISARTINYVEAHGTGTKLGDPIEIKGLQDAFKQYTDDKQFCAIGSVKSNIGHLEAAAGMAGLIKVLLQMKYKKLVPSLHSEELNPNIDFNNSCFFVQQEVSDWNRVVIEENGQKKEYPRRSGISSFGAGGANAHIIIEEYEDDRKRISIKDKYYLFCISAPDHETLLQKVKDLNKFIINNYQELRIEDVSYTLNIGRDHFDKKVAIISNSFEELIKSLTLIIEDDKGKKDSDIFDSQSVLETVDRSDIEKQLKEFNVIKNIVIDKEELIVFAKAYVLNLELDLSLLFVDIASYKISLPSYPFKKDYYWFDKKYISNDLSTQKNKYFDFKESDTDQNCFIVNLNCDHFCFQEHQLHNHFILPGVAHIEMILAVLLQKLKTSNLSLRDVCWKKPIFYQENLVNQVLIILTTYNLETKYEIKSKDKATLYSNGHIYQNIQEGENNTLLDINQWENECNSNINIDKFYQNFIQMGWQHGEKFRVVKSISHNSQKTISFAIIKLSNSNIEDLKNYVLSPSLFDGVLQTVAVLQEQNLKNQIYIPYRIEELNIYSTFTEKLYVVASSLRTQENIKSYNIKVYDQKHKMVLRILNFQMVSSDSGQLFIQKNHLPSLFYPYLFPVSYDNKDINYSNKDLHKRVGIFYNKKTNLSVFNELNTKLTKYFIHSTLDNNEIKYKFNNSLYLDFLEIKQSTNIDSILILLDEESYQNINSTILLIKNIFNAIINNSLPIIRIILLSINTSNAQIKYSWFYEGFIKTLALETKKLQIKYLVYSGDIFKLSLILNNEFSLRDWDSYVSYCKDNLRYIKKYRCINYQEKNRNTIYIQNGYYIIIGYGGIAKQIVQCLISYNANILVLSRSNLSNDDKLWFSKNNIQYEKVDILEQNHLKVVITNYTKNIKVQAIFYLVGNLRDTLLINLSQENIEQVIHPKIQGLLNLSQAIETIDLDYFLLFSSLASVNGNIGQSVYAGANNFVDYYSIWQEKRRIKREISYKTISINWPYWQEGGMRVGDEKIQQMKKEWNVAPITTEIALKIIDYSCQINIPNVSFSNYIYPIDLERNNIADEKNFNIKESIISSICKIQKINRSQFNFNLKFNDYGFDSIALTELANSLNQNLKIKINPSTFYEYSSIKDFIDKISVEHEQNNLLEISYGNQVIKNNNNKHDICITGYDVIFPGSSCLKNFWYTIKNAVVHTQLLKNCTSRNIPNQKYYGGFIEGIDYFDASFFNISRQEAELIDPQQRLMLQSVWKALENAGYDPIKLKNKNIGVFVGASTFDYGKLLRNNNIKNPYIPSGTVHSLIANRISYFFDWNGPSEAIDTACSSSLVALHRAILAFKNNEIDKAVVCGVNLLLDEEFYESFMYAGMLSNNSAIKVFDKEADGYVRAEGLGVLILEKENIENKNCHGIILGSAVNHGGNASSLTSPNPIYQHKLLKDCYNKNGIDFGSLGYIEAHGTGTKIGDPIEMNALVKVSKELNKENQYSHNIAIGSVKANIGHLEPAAGIAGIIKVIEMFKNKYIPGQANFKELNPYIDFSGTHFYIEKQGKEWERPIDNEGNIVPRRAGVSSFGFGGSNAHVILEEGLDLKKVKNNKTSHSYYLIKLSAKTKEALKIKVEELLDWVSDNLEGNLDDISYTLNVCRSDFENRLVLLINNLQELSKTLKDYIRNEDNKNVIQDKNKLSDDDLSYIINNLEEDKYKENLYKLGSHYNAGFNIDWSLLHQGYDYSVVELPTYPFAKERYWFKENTKEEIVKEEIIKEEVKKEVDPNQHYYVEKWESIGKYESQLEISNDVLIIYSEESVKLAQSLLELEKEEGKTVDELKINILEEVKGIVKDYLTNNEVKVIYYLSGISQGDLEHEYLLKTQKLGVESLLLLVHSLIETGYEDKKIKLKIISNDVYSPLDQGVIKPYGASMHGFSQSLSKEYSNWEVLCLDISGKILKNLEKEEVTSILSEEGTGVCEPIVLRDGFRYRRYLSKIELDEPKTQDYLEEGATYLLLGGAGGIGLTISEYLLKEYKANIILVGRKKLEGKRKEDIDYLNTFGNVQYIQADLNNINEQNLLIMYLKTQYTCIDIVFFLIMSLNDKAIVNSKLEDFMYSVYPKVIGSYILEKMIEYITIKKIISFSSVQSYFNLSGQALYASSTAYQDSYFLYFKEQYNIDIKLINWSIWSESGAVAKSNYLDLARKRGFIPINNKEGINALFKIINNNRFKIAFCPFVNQEKYQIFSKNCAEKKISTLDEIIVLLIFSIFKILKINIEDSFEKNFENLIKENIILPKYKILLKDLYITMLSHRNIVEGSKFSSNLSLEDKNKFIGTNIELKPFIELAWLCYKNYVKILNGELDVTEVFFQNQAIYLYGVYYDNVISNLSNDKIKVLIEKYIKNNHPNPEIRILEIGAGLGGTTIYLDKNLDVSTNILHYTFSDISEFFIQNTPSKLNHNKIKYEFKIFDINKDFESQISTVKYDIILASNALHVAEDMENVLNKVNSLLKENGLLILNEPVTEQIYLNFIFGLFDNWFNFREQEYRIKNSPLITLKKWEDLCYKSNFINFKCAKIQDVNNLGQQVFSVTKDKLHSNQDYNQILVQLKNLLHIVIKTDEQKLNEDILFSELGVDSISGISFISAVNKFYNFNLKTTIIFQYKTLKELTEYILKFQEKNKQNKLMFMGEDIN